MSDLFVVAAAVVFSVLAVGLGIYVVRRISRVRIHPRRRPLSDGPVPAPDVSLSDNFREPDFTVWEKSSAVREELRRDAGLPAWPAQASSDPDVDQ